MGLAVATGDGKADISFLLPQFLLEVLVKFLPEQAVSDVDGAGRGHNARASRDDRALRQHPAVGAVCHSCGARIGKPCVSTVRAFGVGTVGGPIEGVHAERIAHAREQGLV
jgi:hypothetical protein